MSAIYNIAIYIYQWIIGLVSLFKPKAKLWIDGRKDWEKKLTKATKETNNIIWFHAASLGEFEQGRPLMERIKEEQKDIFILLTFFSPSGFEVQKNYKGADYICYLPADTKKNASKFISITKPKKVFFVKYEFWFNYMNQLKKQDTPLYLISGIFRKEQLFFKSYGTWFKNQLNAFTYFFVQNKSSVEMLNSLGFNNVMLTGDTRFDRVIQIAESSQDIEQIKKFVNKKECLVIGSSWPIEEDMLSEYINNHPNYKYILAPHEIDKAHISNIKSKLKVPYQTWSSFKEEKPTTVLIIDNIGMLSSLYKYGTLAYVGGAFGSGLHNILEASVYGIPVIYGPKIKRFQEAQDLIELDAAFSISDKLELFQRIDVLLEDKSLANRMGGNAKSYIFRSQGASSKVFENIFSE